jgi:ElaB/YqjD/DUF883 family membrane-anchored ribosome-binding protein
MLVGNRILFVAIAAERSASRPVDRRSKPKDATMASPDFSTVSRAAGAGADLAESAASVAHEAKAGFDEAMDDISQKGREAVRSARDVWDGLDDLFQESVRARPYSTLAVAALIGFLYAVARQR